MTRRRQDTKVHEVILYCCCLPVICVVFAYDAFLSNRDRIPFPFKDKLKRRQERRCHERKRQAKRDAAPKPLPLHRKYNLSVTAFKSHQTQKVASQCLFLTNLPIEIRWKIYTYVLGNHLLHLVHRSNYLAHIRCKLSLSPQSSDLSRSCRPAAVHTSYKTCPILASTANGNLALLQSCRQVYQEAAPLLYSTNAFDFDHQDLFLYFAQTVLPQRLAVIRTLHLNCEMRTMRAEFVSGRKSVPATNGWRLMWETIATKMPALRHLHVKVEGDTGNPYPSLDDWWMQSMLRVRGLSNFRFQLRAPVNAYMEFGEEVFRMNEMLEEEIREVVCMPKAEEMTAKS